jgi:hypothetical protein
MLAIENTAFAADLAYSVGAVHQRDTVHAAESQDETSVDSPDDLLLLLWCEGINMGIVHGVGVFGQSALKVFDSAILLNLRRIEVGDWGRHGWEYKQGSLLMGLLGQELDELWQMEGLRDWGIRCLLVRILLLWLHTPIVTTYSHRHTGRNSSSAAFDGKSHHRSTRYVQVYHRRADKRATNIKEEERGEVGLPRVEFSRYSRFSVSRE